MATVANKPITAEEFARMPNPADGSHRLRAASSSDALIVLDEGVRDYAAGDLVEVVPL